MHDFVLALNFPVCCSGHNDRFRAVYVRVRCFVCTVNDFVDAFRG